MTRGIVAHQGQPPEPHDVWASWAADPTVAVALAVAAGLYIWAVGRRPVPRWRAACGAVALVALAVALVSPLEAVATALASAHMVQHVVVVLVAAPLLALARPTGTVLRALPMPARRTFGRLERALRLPRAGRVLQRPVVAWLLHAGVIWVWHSAVLYDLALRSPLVHGVEHLSFLVTGVVFWAAVLGGRRFDAASSGRGVLLLFTMGLQSVVLAALLTFSPTPWYTAYTDTTSAWGIDPLTDQQLAGVIMWVPAGFVYVGAALALLMLWIRDSEATAPPLAAASR